MAGSFFTKSFLCFFSRRWRFKGVVGGQEGDLVLVSTGKNFKVFRESNTVKPSQSLGEVSV